MVPALPARKVSMPLALAAPAAPNAHQACLPRELGARSAPRAMLDTQHRQAPLHVPHVIVAYMLRAMAVLNAPNAHKASMPTRAQQPLAAIAQVGTLQVRLGFRNALNV